MRKLLTWTIVVLIVAGIGFGVWWFFIRKADAGAVVFKTAPVKRGDLNASIAATGTIEPEEVIDVGAQVAGRITKFGLDSRGQPIDYSSLVKGNPEPPDPKGPYLAKIDDSVYQSAVASARAQLQVAEAGVTRSQADLESAEAKLTLATRDWTRAQEIRKQGGTEAIAQNQYDQYESAYLTATAAVKVSKAMVEQAKATVAQASAALEKAERELGYCTIYSPVDGVVIARRVNVGQTVVASLNAPSLFLIAKDLKRMEVWAPVNEADIGHVHEGQDVSFTVDAMPGRTFKGTVQKVRLEPTITQSVVTYTVEITTQNQDESLRPYQTANVKFTTDERKGVLSVPNAALRYTPPVENMVPEAREKYGQAQAEAEKQQGGGAAPAAAPRQPRPTSGPSTNPTGKPRGSRRSQGVVWVVAGPDLFKPIEVKLGMTDGANTEVLGNDLNESMQVVVGDTPKEAEGTPGGTNPFAPQFRRSGGSSRGR
jgi:HlyD family secretion protein